MSLGVIGNKSNLLLRYGYFFNNKTLLLLFSGKDRKKYKVFSSGERLFNEGFMLFLWQTVVFV